MSKPIRSDQIIKTSLNWWRLMDILYKLKISFRLVFSLSGFIHAHNAVKKVRSLIPFPMLRMSIHEKKQNQMSSLFFGFYFLANPFFVFILFSFFPNFFEAFLSLRFRLSIRVRIVFSSSSVCYFSFNSFGLDRWNGDAEKKEGKMNERNESKIEDRMNRNQKKKNEMVLS